MYVRDANSSQPAWNTSATQLLYLNHPPIPPKTTAMRTACQLISNQFEKHAQKLQIILRREVILFALDLDI